MNEFLNNFVNSCAAGTNIDILSILTTVIVSFVLQLLISFVYIKTHRGKNYSQSFVETIVILGVVISVIIIAIGNNVARAFSLGGALSIIRFRSSMRDPKDIAFIFFAMATGLVCGGKLFLPAITFTVVVCGIIMLLYRINFGLNKSVIKTLRISIPESMNYDGLFDDVLKGYVEEFTLMSVTTINMGTMFELKYSIREKDKINEKEFIDEIRIRNGNLRVSVTLDNEEKSY